MIKHHDHTGLHNTTFKALFRAYFDQNVYKALALQEVQEHQSLLGLFTNTEVLGYIPMELQF